MTKICGGGEHDEEDIAQEIFEISGNIGRVGSGWFGGEAINGVGASEAQGKGGSSSYFVSLRASGDVGGAAAAAV